MSGSPDRLQEIGIVEWLRPGEFERVETLIEEMRRLSVTRLRTGVSWADWHTPGGIQWYDWLMPRLGAEFELLPCCLYTPPSLAIAEKTSAPPINPKDYADFLDLVIKRYGEWFEWVELWNEPNNHSEWDSTLDPHYARFAEMVGGAAYWAHTLGKKTVLGGMSPIDPHWLCCMFERGVMDQIDAVGVHGFPDTFDYTWKGWETNVALVREVLERNGSTAEIWITEAGFSTWQYDELEQVKKFMEFSSAPADRSYWYGMDDLDRGLPAVDRFHLDEREYFFGLKGHDGTKKLLFRLWEKGGLQAMEELCSLAIPGPLSKEKPALITGGAGFIGTNLADRLLLEGHDVILYDNLSRPGVEKNLAWLKKRHGDRVRAEIGDTRNEYYLRKIVREAGSVWHLAAQVAVTTSLVNPAADFRVNGLGTLNLLEAIRSCDDPPPLLFTSTNKVYGSLADIPLRVNGGAYEPEGEIRATGIGEDRPLDFHSPYGCSKGCADQYILDYARSYGIPAAVFRMSCIYGPHQMGNEDQGWVAHFLISALLRRPLTIYGDGRQVRDILYVDDLVEALLSARRNIDTLAGKAFNIGGGVQNSISLLDLLDMIRDLHGDLPPVEFSGWRTGDQRYYVSDTLRFRAATGWQPQVAPAEGLARLYRWLCEGQQRVRRPAVSSYPPLPAEPMAALEAAR